MAITKNIGKAVVYYQSAAKYVGIINFILILATFKATYNINISNTIIIPIGIIGIIIIGTIDYKYILKHQIAHQNEQNNLLQEIRKANKKIEELGEKKK